MPEQGDVPGIVSEFNRPRIQQTGVQDQNAPWVPGDFISLGADGFGISDTRAVARRYFHVDGPSVVVRALQMLAQLGEIYDSVAREAAGKYRLLDVAAGTSRSGGES